METMLKLQYGHGDVLFHCEQLVLKWMWNSFSP